MRRAVVLGLLVLLLVAAATYARLRVQPAPRAAARQLLDRANAAALDGRAAQQLDLLFAAAHADPTYLPAIVELYAHPGIRFYSGPAEARIEHLAASIADAELADCVRKLMLIRRERYAPMSVSSGRARECTEFYLSAASVSFDPDQSFRWHTLELARRYPESAELASAAEAVLLDARDWQRSRAFGRELVASRFPIRRALGFALLRHAEVAIGSDSAAQRVDQEARRALRAWPLALVRYDGHAFAARSLPLDSVLRYGDRLGQLVPVFHRAMNAYGDGSLAESERLWRYLLANYGDIRGLTVTAHLHLGRTHMKAGRLKQAESELLLARTMTRQDSTPANLSQAEHNLFHVYEGLNDRARALQAGWAYLNAASARQFSGARMMAHHDLGWYYWRLGNYREARSLLDRMLALIDTTRMDRHFAGEYYERIGDLDRALDMYDLAARLERTDYRSVARRALIAAQMGDRTRAIRLAELHDTALGPGYPEFTPQLPAILARFGMLDSALHAAERASVRARARNQAAAAANLMLERAALELKLGRAARGGSLADSAMRYARAVGNFETEMIARGTRAFAAVKARRAQSEIDSLRALAAQAARARLPGLELQLQTLLGDALVVMAADGAALSAYAAAAARNDQLAESLSNDADRARYRSTATDVSDKALSLILAREPGDAARAFANWSVQRKARGIRAGGKRIAIARPGSDEAFIDYVVLDSSVAALVVTRDRRVLRTLPITPAQLELSIRVLQETLTPRIGAAIDIGRSRFDVLTAHMLYRALVAPLLADIHGARQLTIIADGPLHYLPFDALVTEPRPRARYLVERFTIRHAPSLAFAPDTRVSAGRAVLAFAGNAAEAQEEILAIANHASVQLRVMPVFAAAATEQRVRSFAGDASIVHFATHAAPNDASPLFAYLALRADAKDDGRLHAFEIEQLTLKHALVVLSGCDTGRGYPAGGEGVLSLSRAFLRAGASATVATLWPVGQGSPELMSTFYSELSRGRTPAQALRTAKLHALQGSYANPLYWAPFVLITA